MTRARTAIDTIIQGSTVELFHTQGLAVAPLDTSVAGTNLQYDCLGIIGFEGPAIKGKLTLAIPADVFRRQSSGTNNQLTTLNEWTQELTNQLMGRIKNRLLQFQVALRTHLPITLSRSVAVQQKKPVMGEIAYTFRALRGDIVVTVDESLANAKLNYSNTDVVAPDGELLLL